ncbi:MAG TPA: hypothetical protein VD994_00020, partial [Prosthecobacter sp.]|nr:hypothetical protein [Prosthecobacter sp.]
MLTDQLILNLHRLLMIDSFAGGGGASTGMWMATGRHVDHAFNHAFDALGMHRINHPQTVHHMADVFDIDPKKITEGRPVGLAHFSPDCKHFSKAKGGKPLDKRIRGLVLVMLRWAAIRAEVLTMENVEEIVTWGPLVHKRGTDGKMGWYPDPAQKGRTWKAFLACLSTGIDADHPDLPEILDVLCGSDQSPERAHWRHLLIKGFGYRFEYRELKGYHYGAPTIRNRLFMVARCDGRPILWPTPTHEDPRKIKKGDKLLPWTTIAECIDWHLPCPSIFLTAEAAKELGFKIKRPLVKATQKRIAKGIDRYVLKAKRPFLVSLTHQGGDRVEGVDEPARTVTGAHRGEKGVVIPAVTKYHGNHEGREDGQNRHVPINGPLPVQDTSNRFGLVTGTVIGAGGPVFSGKPVGLDRPHNTQTTENHSALVGATLIGAGGRAAQSRPRGMNEPHHTTTSKGDTCLASATLVHVAHGETDSAGNPRRGRGARDVQEPAPTLTTSKDCAIAEVALAPLLTEHANASSQRNMPANEPMRTACGQVKGGHFALVSGTLVNTCNGKFDEAPSRSIDPEGPLPTVTAEQKFAVASVNMVKFRGDNVGSSIEEPMHTASAGGTHHGLVGCTLVQTGYGERDGQEPRALDPNKPLGTVVAG